MQNLLVLGLIPGTDIQLDFTSWLIICLVMLLVTLLVRERHTIRAYVLSRYVAHLIKRHQLA